MDIKNLHSWLGNLTTEQSPYREQWCGVSKYVVPTVRDIRYSGSTVYPDCFNSVGIDSAIILASSIYSSFSNRAIQWFNLVDRDSQKNQSSEVREYLQGCTRILFDAFGNSKFYSDIYSVYLSMVGFGPGCLLIEEYGDGILRPQSLNVYKIHCAQNHYGIIDTIFIEDRLSSYQLVSRWPKLKDTNKLIKEKYEKNPFELIDCVHFIGPKNDWNLTNDEHTFASVWYLQGDQTPLNKDGEQYEGYYEQPFFVPRYAQADSSDVMGIGPGRRALPSLMSLMKTVEHKFFALPMTINPAIVTTEDNIISVGNNGVMGPGVQIEVKDINAIKPWISGANIAIAELEEEKIIQQVERMFFVNELKLENSRPEMSAYEVAQRVGLVYKLLGPTAERINSECLNPAIERCFGILHRAKKFPDMPKELSEKTIDIESTNSLTRSQRSDEVMAAKDLLQNLIPLAQVDPLYLELVDFEKYLTFVAERTGAPVTVLRSTKEFQKLKKERDEATARMQQINEGQEAATGYQRLTRGMQAEANARKMMNQ